ncbi:Cerebral protein-like protein [Leptotrombidium deliense]|uniref:Ribosomal RNA-processing protein 8 n=1 Tax=Leptotrombidium deliense TaxID=299467 RepID=A0A443SQL9_9ACAR|nr:Cerebral protein-like protein [Leptotrombidium deliense]
MSATFAVEDRSNLKKHLLNKRNFEKVVDSKIERRKETRKNAKKRKASQMVAVTEKEERKAAANDRSCKLARLCDERLKSSQFRAINEYLYTHPSDEATRYMNKHLFATYHEAYESIVNKWPIKPIDSIIDAIEQYSTRKRLIIADLGCGKKPLLKLHFNEATVHSFDLIAAHENVIAADITSVPLEDSLCDFAVFCLSLMGTNVNDYLFEANRILKLNGRLLIAEVVSRFDDDVNHFSKSLRHFGFTKVTVEHLPPNKFFVLFSAVKTCNVHKSTAKRNVPDIQLKPCHYKSR